MDYTVTESDGKFPNLSAEEAEVWIANVYTSVFSKRKISANIVPYKIRKHFLFSFF